MARSIRRPASLRVRLRLLALEERAVPTVFTVTNTSDSGTGSLRAAITAADADTNAPQTINFSNSTAAGNTNFYHGTAHTITLASALPNITQDMPINGPGAATLTITGYTAGVRVFNQATANLTFSGLTLTGRVTGSGAAIAQTATNENLTIGNSVITGSSAGGRGAVYNMAGGTVTLSGCTVSNNTAAGGVLWVNESSAGGATLNILNSQVLNNTSTGPGGAVGSYFGGALTVTNSTLAGNSTSGGGGAMYLWGTPAGTTTISSSTIANNTAAGGGGAILLTSGTNTLTVSNSTVANNTAAGSGGAIDLPTGINTTAVTSSTLTGNVGLTGGAIVVSGGSPITLDNAILSGNTAGGVPEVSSTYTVGASYCALDTLAGMSFYTDNGGNLSPANSTPAALHLRPLVNALGPAGPLGVIGLGAGSTGLDAGDPAQGGAGHADEIGTLRPQSPGVDIGAVEEVPGAPHVLSVVVAGPFPERSEVRQIKVTFDNAVNFTGGTANAAAAFQLLHVSYGNIVYNTLLNNLQAAVTTNSGQMVVTLTFTTAGNAATEIDPVSAQNGGQPSLADGQWQLTILTTNVTSGTVRLAGDGTTAGVNYVSPPDTGSTTDLHLFRLFGDATGNGYWDLSDLQFFRDTYNTAVGNPGYVAVLDANNDGVIDLTDLAEFRNRFGKHT
jgi:hypothetical protein